VVDEDLGGLDRRLRKRMDADRELARRFRPRHEDLADESRLESRRRNPEHVVDGGRDAPGVGREERRRQRPTAGIQDRAAFVTPGLRLVLVPAPSHHAVAPPRTATLRSAAEGQVRGMLDPFEGASEGDRGRRAQKTSPSADQSAKASHSAREKLPGTAGMIFIATTPQETT